MMVGFSNRGSLHAVDERRFQDFVEFRREEVEGSIPGRFERQVDRYPDRLAVRTQRSELTYDDLNRAANRVAFRLLSARGPRAEQVAVLFERGAGIIPAALGVLKAGKVLVPLDASYPQARNSYILKQSQASILVTNDQYARQARELLGDQSLLLNVDELGSGLPDGNVGISVSPDTVACILYTSGSTGIPLGVVHNHRTLLHFIRRYTNALRVCPADRLSQLASCGHIAGLSDLLRGLLNGAAVLPFDPRMSGPAELADWLSRESITICHLVPTLFRHLVGGLTGDERFAHLRLIHLGGEPASRRDVELYRRHFPRTCALLNNLGCTEVSSFRQYLIDHDTVFDDDAVPVGYAVEDTDVLLLDESGCEVPVGDMGEIAVKSRYLALGYWGESGLMTAAFKSLPGGMGERLYRTGDLGSLLPDGRLMYLGRKDFQIEIRGYRVEAAEVEKALLDSGELEAAVVIGGEDPFGETQLIAYLVPGQRQARGAGRLRTLLQARLPSFMVPAAFVWLDALPRLPNGKLDRRALPSPDWARPLPDQAFAAPRTAVEEAITAVWAEVLGVERVGIHDDFFALGAHSLHLTRALSRIRQALRVDLQVDAFVESPTVAGLAQAIERIRTTAGARDVGCSAVAAPEPPVSTLSLRRGRTVLEAEGLLSQLEQMSEEEARRALDAESPPSVKARRDGGRE